MKACLSTLVIVQGGNLIMFIIVFSILIFIYSFLLIHWTLSYLDGHVEIALWLQTSHQVAFGHVILKWEELWLLFKHLGALIILI